VVHAVAEASERLDHIEWVTHTSQHFIAGKGQVFGDVGRMVSFDDPDSVVNDVLSFEALDLQSSGSVETDGRTS